MDALNFTLIHKIVYYTKLLAVIKIVTIIIAIYLRLQYSVATSPAMVVQCVNVLTWLTDDSS